MTLQPPPPLPLPPPTPTPLFPGLSLFPTERPSCPPKLTAQYDISKATRMLPQSPMDLEPLPAIGAHMHLDFIITPVRSEFGAWTTSTTS